MDINRIRILMISLLTFTLCFLLLPFPIHAASRGITVKALTSSGAIKDIKLYSGYHALVIGIGDYRKGWPRLPNPVKDAEEVATMLKNFGWTVDVLADPDGATLRSKLNRLVTGPGRKREKAILVWYSGHGQTIEEADGTKLGYLVPVDAPDPDKDLFGFMERAVSMRQIETVSKQIMSKHVLMLFDSCFSGAIFQMVRAKPSPYIQEKVSYPVRQFITAGTENEQVPDKSVFKDVFVQGLKDGFADLNRDNYITGQEIGSYLQEKVVNYSRKAQHPQYGKINNPKLDKGDFVFNFASSGAVIEEKAPEPSNAYLSVEASVSRARVFVDGKYVGATPFSKLVVSPGEHLLKVEIPGYETYQKRIRLEKGRSKSLYVDLSQAIPRKGRLYVDTQLEGARVRILNIGPEFYQGMELDAGNYHVEVSAVGHKTKNLWVLLEAGEVKTLDIHLEVQSQIGTKIGLIDFQYILENSVGAKTATARINSVGKKMEKDLKAKGAEIDKSKKEFEKYALIISKDEKDKRSRKIRKDIDDFKTLKEKYISDFKRLEKEFVEQLQKEFLEIIQKKGQKEGYLLIREKKQEKNNKSLYTSNAPESVIQNAIHNFPTGAIDISNEVVPLIKGKYIER